MARSVVVDAGFLVALLSRDDRHHGWARGEAARTPPPWITCEAVLSESFFLLGGRGGGALAELLRRAALRSTAMLDSELERVLQLMERYAEVPMSLADACLVRMTETLPEPLLLTTDADFRIYRRFGRQVVPARLPGARG